MNKKYLLLIIIIIVMAGIITGILIHQHKSVKSLSEKLTYYCPMHPNYTSDKPGECPICGMSLIKKESQQHPAKDKKKPKILYYKNPMNPEVTSPVPMKDSMGMDYVPVYESSEPEKIGVYISPEKQKIMGIRTQKITMKALTNQVRTVGKIAHDPELYIAQVEYLQAYSSFSTADTNFSTIIKDQSRSLLAASKEKLIHMGMSEQQIIELRRAGKPKANLYLPVDDKTVWVYINIYEYEIGIVKQGQTVVIDTDAYPGEYFSGRITSITPILDPATRSIQVRAEVLNTGFKLKPEMYVDARINIVLGKKLALPESALMDTGERTIVFISKSDGYFETRLIKIGHKANGYYEVLGGLKEGEAVVTDGNFFIDSESRLKSAIMEETGK